MKFNIRGTKGMLAAFFAEEKIEYFGVLPFSACRLRRPDIIERKGISSESIESAIMLLVPYYVNDGAGNISLYARSGDYHHYCDLLFERLLPKLEARFGGRFLGFADKSPIEENIAASMAGLGKLGDNYMLINEKYGSFVFLGEILSTVKPEVLGFDGKIAEPAYCPHCGACKRACPMMIEDMECLSAVTQKKGVLSDAEADYLKKYVPIINNWGICDCCCSTWKFMKKDQAYWFTFLDPYLKSENEFEVRFAIVSLLDHFINNTYLERLLQVFEKVKHEGYYVKMAVAWAVSICYIKYPQETVEYLKKNTLDDFTHNKAIQKIRESYRVSEEEKENLLCLKR